MAAAVASPLQPLPSSTQDERGSALKDYLSKTHHYYARVAETSIPESNSHAADVEHSKPGAVKPHTIIDSEADWTPDSLRGREDEYTYRFSKSDTAELLAAVEKLRGRGISSEEDVKQLTKEDYDLPNLTTKLLEIARHVTLGRGFHLVKGFPVEHFKGDRLGLVLAFWGLGIVLGRPLVSQTDYTENGKTFGSILNHVTVGRFTAVRPNRFAFGNKKGPEAKPAFKGDNFPLIFHSDQGATDLIALLSVNKAKSGGDSKWTSGVTIHNELLRRGRKDLVEVLSNPELWRTPKKLDQATYARNDDDSFVGFEPTPPFEYHDGYLTVHYDVGNYLEKTDLTPLQEEAIWTFARIAEDPAFHFSVVLQPGDIEIIHNPTILHGRGPVEDGEELDEKRHLLRWWIAQPKDQNPRPIAPTFAPRGSVSPDGGFRVPKGSNLRLPFFPYSRHDGEGQTSY